MTPDQANAHRQPQLSLSAIVAGMQDFFGADALEVAERQRAHASGETHEAWTRVVNALAWESGHL